MDGLEFFSRCPSICIEADHPDRIAQLVEPPLSERVVVGLHHTQGAKLVLAAEARIKRGRVRQVSVKYTMSQNSSGANVVCSIIR